MLKNKLVIILLLVFPVVAFSQVEYAYDSKGKRDPFIPLVSPEGVLIKLDKEEKASSVLSVEGIIYDKQGLSYALVAGNVVRVGDTVSDGYQVLKIEKNKVIFIKDGQLTEVLLKEEENAK